MNKSLLGLFLLLSIDCIGQQTDSNSKIRVNGILTQALTLCKQGRELDRADLLADSGIALSSGLGIDRLNFITFGFYIKGRVREQNKDYNGEFSILDSTIQLCRKAYIDTGYIYARTLLHFARACEMTGHSEYINDALIESMHVFKIRNDPDFVVAASNLLTYYSNSGQLSKGDQLILQSEQRIDTTWPVVFINYFYFGAYQYYWKYKIINKARYYISKVDEAGIKNHWELCNLFRSKLLFILEESSGFNQKDYTDLLIQCMDCFHNDLDIQGVELVNYHFNCAEVIIRSGLAEMALADSLLLKADSIMNQFANNLSSMNESSPLDQLSTLWILQGMSSCKKSDTVALEKIVTKLDSVTNGFKDFKNLDTARIGQFLSIAGKYYSMTRNQHLASILDAYKAINGSSFFKAFNFMTSAELNQFIQVKLNSSFDIYFELYQEGILPEDYTDFLYEQALYSKGLLYRQSIGLKRFLGSSGSPEVVELKNKFEVLNKKLEQNQNSSPDLLFKERELLEKKLLNAYHKNVNPDSFSVRQIRSILRNGEISVEFVKYRELLGVVHSDKYAALILDHEHENARFISLFTEAEYQASHKGVHEISQINLDSGSVSRGLKKIIADLAGSRKFKLIWEPILAQYPHVNTIYYSSTGSLNLCNLSCLPISDTELMINRFDMVQLSSTNNLLSDLSKTSVPESAILIGGVNYGDIRSDGSSPENYTWNYLNGTLEEVIDINTMIEEVGVMPLLLKDTAADKKGIIKALGQPAEIIHFATHGYYFNQQNDTRIAIYQENEPLKKSRLVLAGVNSLSDKGHDITDGYLSAYEISKMDLSGTWLVVLSACKTAMGDLVNQYESSYSLMRGFKIAGAKYILSSLRPVSDQETLQFMHLFYENWLDNGNTIQQAFILTQRAMQKQNAQNLNWSAFVLLN